MPYPDEFQGFMITELGKYTDFHKQSVCVFKNITIRPRIFANETHSSNPKSLATVISTSRLSAAGTSRDHIHNFETVVKPQVLMLCSVCGSDVHTVTGGWGDAPTPIAVGHEIVGKAVKVGSKVKDVKVGDRVGVGAQVWSCLECPQCLNNHDNYCPKQVGEWQNPNTFC
jgi:alcohol dehydrogenase (NADP+)